ncbi:MAG: UDP-2,3-diacylglucosamine diphosphatase LpxI [Pseudomonadota bacterium]
MTLALITGRGSLPAAVAQAQDVSPLVYALEGHVPRGLKVDKSFYIERLGGLMHRMARAGVREVCLCGAVDRPRVALWRLDARTWPLVPVIRQALAGGEDSALRAVLGLFEDKGFVVRGAHELAPDLLPPEGVLTQAQPGDDIEANLAVAAAVAAEQGRSDQGQSCVIRAGQVIAQEDSRGTDAMLRGLLAPPQMPEATDPFEQAMDVVGDLLSEAADWLSGPVAEARALGKGGVFFKTPKPGQDLRVDLPTIGPETARGAVAAGLDGLVIEAGGVMVLDRADVVRILNEAGLFLWVR